VVKHQQQVLVEPGKFFGQVYLILK
jgi:hypothetical protein